MRDRSKKERKEREIEGERNKVKEDKTENDRHKWSKRKIRSVNDDGGITKTNESVDRKRK